MENRKLTLGSLFDGSGGFPLGGLLCGITPVFSSEIEPFPIRVTTKRLPFVKHYGDVSVLNGAELPPVDVITFGSPCQDMSIAGKRAGLDGSRSNLFYEAVRIVKEMRCATDGKSPRFIVWENVPGAFSSNKGEDFKAVLETVCSVKDGKADIPRYEKWPNAGEILADDYSVAWRVLDAQHWGVPQRRKRIFLVADFADKCAGKILFESEGLSGYSAEGFRSWQRAAGGSAPCSGKTGGICLNDQGGKRMDISEDVSSTLRAETHGHAPCVMDAAGFCTEHSSKARGIGYEKEKSPTLRAGVVPAAVYENHSQDTRYTGPLDIAPTVSSTYGTGGNNQPFVVKDSKAYDVRITSDGTKNARANVYETDTARTIDTGIPSPDRNQGGLAIVGGAHDPYREESIAPTVDTNGAKPTCNQVGVSVVESYSSSKNSHHTKAEKELANTLVATDYKDPPTVSYGIGRDAFNQGRNAKFAPSVEEELQPTLVAKGPGAVQNGYTVRRLTPTECARLQGFPDWWCAGLATENPTDEDISFWREVFETHRMVMGTSSKPKTDKQIMKWLKDPYSDAAEYKMWGNGVALPCVTFVLAGIVYYAQLSGQ